jgi:hypothetical protein
LTHKPFLEENVKIQINNFPKISFELFANPKCMLHSKSQIFYKSLHPTVRYCTFCTVREKWPIGQSVLKKQITSRPRIEKHRRKSYFKPWQATEVGIYDASPLMGIGILLKWTSMLHNRDNSKKILAAV